jgi:hypothetical protein
MSKLSKVAEWIKGKDEADLLTEIVAEGESGKNGGYYFTAKFMNLSELINLLENQLNENKKHEIVKKLTTLCTSNPTLIDYNLDRQKARILNVIDLNINPINVHALMREVPLINVYNYAFTFDNIIKSFIYNVNPDELYDKGGLRDSSKKSVTVYRDQLLWLSCLLQDPYFIDYKNKGSSTSSRTIMDAALQIENTPTSFNKDKHLYLSKPKYTTNLVNAITSTTLPKVSGKEDIVYNNKFFRNMFFLINLQRVIRLKVKNAVYKINTNVVSDTNILNMRITDYTTADTKIDDNEFEITDLF